MIWQNKLVSNARPHRSGMLVENHDVMKVKPEWGFGLHEQKLAANMPAGLLVHEFVSSQV